MESMFQHDKSVIDYAWKLVNEYNDHEKEQDRLQKEKAHDGVVETNRD